MEVANTKTNNLQIPQNLQNRLNVLDGFYVLYPSVIVTHCVRQIINRVTSSEVQLSAWIPQYYCRDKEATTSHTRDSLMDFNACRPAYSPITLWHVNVLRGWKQINEQRHGVCFGAARRKYEGYCRRIMTPSGRTPHAHLRAHCHNHTNKKKVKAWKIQNMSLGI